MAEIMVIYAWILAHGMAILVALLSLSAVLQEIPWIQANSVFQAVVNGLKWLVAHFPGAAK